MCCGPPGGWFSTSGRREECPHSGPNLAQLWLLGWSVSLWVSASSVGYAVIEIREGQFGTEDAWRLAWVPISQLCDFWRVTVPPGGWWLTFVETEQVMMNPFLCSCAFDLCCSVVPLVADGSWGEGKKQVRTCRATVRTRQNWRQDLFALFLRQWWKAVGKEWKSLGLGSASFIWQGLWVPSFVPDFVSQTPQIRCQWTPHGLAVLPGASWGGGSLLCCSVHFLRELICSSSLFSIFLQDAQTFVSSLDLLLDLVP